MFQSIHRHVSILRPISISHLDSSPNSLKPSASLSSNAHDTRLKQSPGSIHTTNIFNIHRPLRSRATALGAGPVPQYAVWLPRSCVQRLRAGKLRARVLRNPSRPTSATGGNPGNSYRDLFAMDLRQQIRSKGETRPLPWLRIGMALQYSGSAIVAEAISSSQEMLGGVVT